MTKLIPEFFGTSGSGYDNMFDYFTEMTYGRVDRSGTQVLGWIPTNLTRATILGFGRPQSTQACVAAAQALYPTLDITKFTDVVTFYNFDGGGGGNDSSNGFANDAWGLYTGFAAHEITHSLGQLLHSHKEGCAGDYCDRWDEMTYALNFASPGTTWWAADPGGTFSNGQGEAVANSLVAANREVISARFNVSAFLKSEVLSIAAPFTTQTITLAAVNRPDVNGIRVIEFPYASGLFDTDGGKYTVELMRNTGWDVGDPSTGILIHRLELDGQVTLVPSPRDAATDDASWKAGDVWQRGDSPTLIINSIDLSSSTASITITSATPPPPPPPSSGLSSTCSSEYFPVGYGTPTGFHTIETVSFTGPSAPTGVEQLLANGTWAPLLQFTPNAAYPGTTGPAFVIGTQAQGVTTSGAPIGSVQTVKACSTANGITVCDSPSNITIADCCVPLTCAGSCGTMSDGCGGTLQCGGCSGNLKCSTSNTCQGCATTLTCGPGHYFDETTCSCQADFCECGGVYPHSKVCE